MERLQFFTVKKTGILILQRELLKNIFSGHKRLPDIILEVVMSPLPSYNYFTEGCSKYKRSRQSYIPISQQTISSINTILHNTYL